MLTYVLSPTSTERLAARLRAGEDTISFDKDDDDTLDFVTAAANLRSAAYGIPGKSRWEVKGTRISPCSHRSSLSSPHFVPVLVIRNADMLPFGPR